MLFLLGIIILVCGLLISVALHELGHLVPAKLFGVKVSQYFVGFGPTLWSKQVGETEYGIKAIPLGGFVRLSSMLYPGAPGRKTTTRSGKLTMAEEARIASAEELTPEETDRAFWRLSAFKKFVVMFSGPLVNFVLALIVFTIVLVGIGQPTATNTLGFVSDCVTNQEECHAEDEESPAKKAGLQVGDTITAWGDTSISTWKELQSAIAATRTPSVTVHYTRDGQARTASVEPVVIERPVYDEQGAPVKDENGQPVTEKRPYVGVSPRFVQQSQSITAVPHYVGTMITQTAGLVLRLPLEVWNTGMTLINGDDRSGGVVSVVGVADMAGQITSAESEQYGVKAKIGDILSLLGSLNIALFVFNLVPLLPLDGGHMLGALIEGVRRMWARMRGKDDPGPFDTAKFTGVSYGVALAFIAMTVLLVIADIVNPVF